MRAMHGSTKLRVQSVERCYAACKGLKLLLLCGVGSTGSGVAILAEVEKRKVLSKGADHLNPALELAEGGRLEEVADRLDCGNNNPQGWRGVPG